jgi:hypothetical protein
MPSKVIGHDTPIHKLFGTNPDYTKLCVFGCACWSNLRPYNPKKLNFRIKQCTFLGYSSAHKGYNCFDHTIGRIYISRDVVFDEHVFSFAKQRPDITQTPQNSHHPIILHVLTRDTQYSENSLIQGLTEPVVDNVNMRVLQTDPDANKNVSCNSSPSGDVEPNSSSGPLPLISEEQMGSPSSAQPIVADDEVVPDAPQETVIQHPMRTRLRDNIVRNKNFTDGIVRYPQKGRGFPCVKAEQNSTIALSVVSVTEPGDLQQALTDPDWKHAMDEEYAALQRNQTWDLVPPRRGINLIDSRWVYKVKRKADGSIEGQTGG